MKINVRVDRNPKWDWWCYRCGKHFTRPPFFEAGGGRRYYYSRPCVTGDAEKEANIKATLDLWRDTKATKGESNE